MLEGKDRQTDRQTHRQTYVLVTMYMYTPLPYSY